MNSNKKSIIVPMLLIGVMYAVLGFALGINAFFIPFVQEAFHISTAQSYLVMTATFSAFVVFGAFSGGILTKAGYKGGMVIAFVLMAIGFFLITPAARIISFPLLLLALFISGLGQALLTGAVNTYVSIIGPPESGAKRIALMGICNKTFYAVASLMLAVFMDLTNVRIEDTILPFYIITGVLLVMGFLYYFSPLPDVKAIGEEDDQELTQGTTAYSRTKTSIFQFPHLLLGVVAIFFVIGAETVALGTINDYATILNLASPQNYIWLVSIGMIIGYVLGVLFVPKYVSQSQVLLLSTFSGIVITLAILIVPANVSIYLVAFLGLSNAMMWPAVWPLAIADLGKFTKIGSSLLVTGIIGGAFLPLLFGYVAEHLSYQKAYLDYSSKRITTPHNDGYMMPFEGGEHHAEYRVFQEKIGIECRGYCRGGYHDSRVGKKKEIQNSGMGSRSEIQYEIVGVRGNQLFGKGGFLRCAERGKPGNFRISRDKPDIVIRCFMNNPVKIGVSGQKGSQTGRRRGYTKNQMQIGRTKIQIRKKYFLAGLAEGNGKICRKKALAHAAFSAGNWNYLHSIRFLPKQYTPITASPITKKTAAMIDFMSIPSSPAPKLNAVLSASAA